MKLIHSVPVIFPDHTPPYIMISFKRVNAFSQLITRPS